MVPFFIFMRLNLILLSLFILTSPSLQAASMDYYQLENYELKREELSIKGINKTYAIKLFHYSTKEYNQKHIFMSHGYLDNCAYAIKAIKFFLDHQFNVTCYDLPGHGESSGNRGDIDDFKTYGLVIKEAYKKTYQNQHYQRKIFYAHSTGNSGMIELLLNNEAPVFDQYIMAAPLIRSYLYKLTRFGMRYFGRFLRTVPRKFRNLHNQDYRDTLNLDPSPIRKLPTNWVRKNIQWNYELTKKETSPIALDVIFATNDTVIDLNYNRYYIEKHFPNARIQMIQNSGHHFYFQKDAVTEEFFRVVFGLL